MSDNLPDISAESKSFRQLLTNTNYCINLFEELECNRSWTEWASDWAVGERNSINVENMLAYLRKLKEDVQSILTVYGGLAEALDRVKMLKSRNEEFNRILPGTADNSRLIELTKHFNTHVNSQIEKIQSLISKFDETFRLHRKEPAFSLVGTSTTAATTSGIGAVGAIAYAKGVTIKPLLTTTVSKKAIAKALTGEVGKAALVAGIVGGIAYVYLRSKGTARGLQYKQVKELYEVLHDSEIYAKFITHEDEIRSVSKQLNSRVDNYQILFDNFYNNRMDHAFPERSKQNEGEVLKEAMKLYKGTIEKELEELLTEEPDVNEENRMKTAKRVAKNSCKSLLKEKLEYTDVEANEIIELLQN